MLQHKIGTAFDTLMRCLIGMFNAQLSTERFIGCPIDPDALPLDLTRTDGYNPAAQQRT